MMVTSAEANKIINKLNSEIQLAKIKENSNIVFRAAVGENPEALKPDYDFAETQKFIDEKEKDVCRIKHLLNIFNATTKVTDELTIDQVLIRLPQLNNKKAKLTSMITKQPKRRVSITGNVIDYEYISYNLNEARKAYDDVVGEINHLQTELDTINNTVQFEI